MKIRCACGTKYEFELTPEMARRPVRFICPACRADASEFVDGLIRQELGQTATPSGAPISLPLGPASVPIGTAPNLPIGTPIGAAASVPVGVLLDSSPPPPAIQVAVPIPAPAAPAPTPQPRPVARVVARTTESAPPAATAAPTAATPCLKHLGELATEKCFVCGKPICPKCMELFGWVCSPLCKAKADSHGIKVPVYAMQRDVVEARQWRRVVRYGSSVCIALLLFLGFKIWYDWFGSHPKPVFSVRFPEPSYSGQSVICGPNKDQIVFLHGDLLAKWDMKQKKELWSRHLLDRAKIAAQVEKELKAMNEDRIRALDNGVSHPAPLPDAEKLQREMEREAEAEMALHVRGQNVWVRTPEKMVRYDWNTGEPAKEMTVSQRYGELISRGDELLLVDADPGRPIVTHINLTSCEMTNEDLAGGAAADLAQVGKKGGVIRPGAGNAMAGLPNVPGADMGKPMDPAKVAEQAQHLSLPARIALPATLSATMSQERALNEMDDTTRTKSGTGYEGTRVTMLPTKDGVIEFAVKLVESRIVEVSAMKPPPSKSVLNGNLTASQSLEAANEILNEMQRSRGGDTVEEDQSRYQVTIRHLGTPDTWTGEVIGPPTFYPLETVNVLAANKMIRVMDKNFKQLWSSPLNYNVQGGRVSLDEETTVYGLGPCVEHKGQLYVFDEGVLTCFDMKTGTARWRLISVGITGIFFDDKDDIYVNSTSANPDTLKYSRQIDVTKSSNPVIQKVDSKTGKVYWTEPSGALVNYVAGKYVFTVASYRPYDDEDSGSPFGIVETGLEAKPYLRIRRINPSNGRPLWEHFQQRGPLDIGFDKNTIRLVFKKEVQVLRFFSF